MREPHQQVVVIVSARAVAIKHRLLETVGVVGRIFHVGAVVAPLVAVHALQHPALVVAVGDRLSVGVGYGLYAVV